LVSDNQSARLSASGILPVESSSPAKATVTEKLRQRFFREEDHPYRLLEREIEKRLHSESVLLDAGCGRKAEIVRKFAPQLQTGIGIDMVSFCLVAPDPKIQLLNCDLGRIALNDASVDVVVSRSVMEHLQDPLQVYQEIFRVLRPGGSFVFLTPNLWDYSALISTVVPNKFHSGIVRKVEGRDEEDTFPAFYRSNTAAAVKRLAGQSGFAVGSIRFLGQYPCYLMFNPVLFLIGTAYEKIISKFESLRRLRGWMMVELSKPAL
jgi:SAM-dependent methyltransferase